VGDGEAVALGGVDGRDAGGDGAHPRDPNAACEDRRPWPSSRPP
jgi:hypothetical protein